MGTARHFKANSTASISHQGGQFYLPLFTFLFTTSRLEQLFISPEHISLALPTLHVLKRSYIH
jgi:hypothetical protein